MVKSECKEKNSLKEINYPQLMRWTGNSNDVYNLIVLFTSQTTGTVVHVHGGSKDSYSLGYYGKDWASANNLDFWEKYQGSIILEND